jgi:hypothetical protein
MRDRVLGDLIRQKATPASKPSAGKSRKIVSHLMRGPPCMSQGYERGEHGRDDNADDEHALNLTARRQRWLL